MALERDQALSLLRDQHEFPGPFIFRAFVRPEGRPAVVTAVAAVCGGECSVLEVTERQSPKGTWVSLHLRLQVASAEQVLDVYEVLGALDEVVMAM